MKISSIIPLFAALAAVKAQINPGVYHIKSLASNEVFVGRALHEDRSLLPKRILLVNDADDNAAASSYLSPSLLFLILFSGILNLRLRTGIA